MPTVAICSARHERMVQQLLRVLSFTCVSAVAFGGLGKCTYSVFLQGEFLLENFDQSEPYFKQSIVFTAYNIDGTVIYRR